MSNRLDFAGNENEKCSSVLLPTGDMTTRSTSGDSDEQVKQAEKIKFFFGHLIVNDTELVPLFLKRDGAHLLTEYLSAKYTHEQIAIPNGHPQGLWEAIGQFYLQQKRFYEALSIFNALYEHMLKAQTEVTTWVHKGMPLVWMSECFAGMGFSTLTKRYLMLAFIEDAIREQGSVSPGDTGTYFRLVWRHGLSDTEVKRYAKKIFELQGVNQSDSFFPEWILQELNQDWMTEFPMPMEAGFYFVNKSYANHLISKLGDGTGKALERLSTYLLSCMPGCRTLNQGKSGFTNRGKSHSTDYDIICSIEGFEIDFRSELGRYFVCECKDWKKKADFSTVAKFCRVLDSVKARFGILFSTKGISGKGKTINAERELLKVFQDRGMVIIVVDETELMKVVEGENLINILKRKYEKVRLDLTS